LIDFSANAASTIPAGNAPAASAAPAAKTGSAGEHHHFSFYDFLDIINPLQHLPVVSTLYRKITHDEIGTPEKIIGDTLFGGLGGLVSSLADTVFEKLTGKSMGDTVLALFDGGDKTTAVADNAKAPAPEQKIAATPFAMPPIPNVSFATGAPTVLASANTNASAAATPVSATGDNAAAIALTAALNRAQIDPALAARARFAYGRAVDLTLPKPDAAAFAY